MATVPNRAKKARTFKKPIDEPAWDIALLFPPLGYWTESTYLELERFCGNKMIELVDGCLEVLPRPDMFHHDVVKFLLFRLHDFVVAHKKGEVIHAPLPVRLGRDRFREPDIMFFKPHRIKDRHTSPNGADLVMEVVSPGAKCRQRDLVDKRADYAKAKIPEYWIVDPETKTITVLTLSGKSYKVHGVFKPGDQATSKLLKGFKVAVSDVFAAGEGK